MRRLAEKFPGAFLVFATLKDSLSDAEKSEAAQLALWGRERMEDGFPRAPVIVLTSLELFCPWNLKQTWKDRGEQWAKFAEHARFDFDNLWTLAEITQQLYLGLPDRYSIPTSANVV